MKIGVLSDTHLEDVTPEFEAILKRFLSDCDALIHVGDFTHIRIYEYLKENFKEALYAVCGNMDRGDLRRVLQERMVIEVEGVRLGLIHGWGPPQGIEERIRRSFEGKGIKGIIFGHTHSPINRWEGGILFFNPGSPTDKIYATKNTLGILEVQGGEAKGEIVEVG